MKKSVSFADEIANIRYFHAAGSGFCDNHESCNCAYIEDNCESSNHPHIKSNHETSDYMYMGHEISHRRDMEQKVFHKPHTELERVKYIISSCRNFETTIIFGNLGRQPYLLDYYLDRCFGDREKINLFCRWKTKSPYQTDRIDQLSDFLFVIEPPFGYSIRKPHQVQHMILMTSHLSIDVRDSNKKIFYLHLSSNQRYTSKSNLEDGETFEPPIFHDNISLSVISGDAFFLDVRKSKCANEAYLRCLTGKEIVSDKPHKILINLPDRNIIKDAVSKTRKEMSRLGVTVEEFYWNI